MIIESLEPNQVFVFGSNKNGFHGAGSAGMAMRGCSTNNWRNDPEFLKAVNSPIGSQDRIGKWAVLGCPTGFQSGHNGCSYAVCTIKRAGQKRSITRREIYYQLIELWRFAEAHPELEFLMTPVGQGYSGYSPDEMHEVWTFLLSKHGNPPNIKFTFDIG